MPKVGGKNIEACMEICMSDPKTKSEYPNTDKRQDVCYAACSDRFSEIDDLETLVKKYKNKSKKE